MGEIMKKFLTFISYLIFIVMAATIILFGMFGYMDSPPKLKENKDSSQIHFDIPSGATASWVGDKLETSGIIRSSFWWNLLGKFDKEPIKAGYYTISPPVRMTELRELFVSGKQQLYKITIPEGYSVIRIAGELEKNRICGAKDFLDAVASPLALAKAGFTAISAEGFLYPDTYYFQRAYPAEKVVSKMIETFFKRLDEANIDYKTLSGIELRDKVILASIVEREYRIAQEAALMAGVFYNRLHLGMRLQSCATVVYVLTDVLNYPHPERISTADTRIDHPYNTYLYGGLPPGPICSPGIIALEASFRPEKTDYLYFRILNEEGKHIFSKTLDQHIDAGELYIKNLYSSN